MNIKELLNLDIGDVQKMSRKDLSKAVSTMASAANKRIKRFEQKDIETPAIMGVKRSGGKISTKGKNLNELRSEYVRARTFLTAKTSTAKGFGKVQKEIEVRIGGKLTIDESKEFWSAYNKLTELEPNEMKIYGSDRIQQALYQMKIQGHSTDYMVDAMKHMLKLHYEKVERDYRKKEGAYNGTADFFDLGEDL